MATLLKTDAISRQAEDQMAAKLPGKVVPSYQVLGLAQWKDSDDIYSQKLKIEGFDGIVIMRLVKVEKDQRSLPGTYPPYYLT